VLAAAVEVARREGLPDPLSVTLRFPGVASTEESRWQELVIAHLGVRECERIVVGDELNLLGPVARALNDTGQGITLTSNTGGSTTFSGTTKTLNTGASAGVFSTGSGHTITFSGGGLAISTTTGAAFSATGGGTVTATGTGSTITTTTGTALNVSSPNIGSSGLKFQSISFNGANHGINLSTTGTSGGLTVTVTGSAGSGGAIQDATGEGINLSSTSSPSFTDVVIQNNGADGINSSQVKGLTLAGSTVSGNRTPANVSVQSNDGLDFAAPNGLGSPNGLTGTVSITNSTITGAATLTLSITGNSLFQ
jgi:hypothetical protein